MGPSARRGRGVIGNVKAIGDINHTTLWGVNTQPHPTTSSCDGELREDNGEKKGDICTGDPGSHGDLFSCWVPKRSPFSSKVPIFSISGRRAC